MLKSLINSWKTLILKGVLLIILAILAFTNPTATAASIVMWFAIMIMIDGVVTLITAVREWKEREHKWRFLLEGLLGIVIGVILFLSPGIPMTFIGLVVAFWFILTGINRIMMGIRLRKEMDGSGWVVFNGVLAVTLGLIIAATPYLAVSFLMWIMGFAFLIGGIALIWLGLKLRKGKNKIAGKIDDLKNNIRSEMSGD